MQSKILLGGAMVLALGCLGGCGRSSSPASMTMSPPPPPPTLDTSFVRALAVEPSETATPFTLTASGTPYTFSDTSDSSEPIGINGS